jgi:protein involved in temperature-dependent protein secretion
MDLYFNPEYYYLTDDNDRTSQVIQTVQAGGYYRLQFTNVDSVKSAQIDVYIDDLTTQTPTQVTNTPNVVLGPKRLARTTLGPKG